MRGGGAREGGVYFGMNLMIVAGWLAGPCKGRVAVGDRVRVHAVSASVGPL